MENTNLRWRNAPTLRQARLGDEAPPTGQRMECLRATAHRLRSCIAVHRGGGKSDINPAS